MKAARFAASVHVLVSAVVVTKPRFASFTIRLMGGAGGTTGVRMMVVTAVVHSLLVWKLAQITRKRAVLTIRKRRSERPCRGRCNLL